MEPSQSDHEGSDGDSILSKTTLVLGEQSGGEGLDCPGEGGESENDDVDDLTMSFLQIGKRKL